MAHNAEFDIGFIRAGCRRAGLEFDPTYVDTLFEVGGRHQLVQVFQPHLVFRDEDDVLGPPVGVPLLPQGRHGGVDGLEGVDVQLLLQLFEARPGSCSRR